MKIQILLILLFLVFGFIFYQVRSVPTKTVTTKEIPSILSKLSGSSAYPAYAVFIFQAPGKTGADSNVNIQFSIENGRPGFDWVLLGPRNIADQNHFMAFTTAKGFAPKSMEGNGVKYLRIENGDLAALCSNVITQFYGVPKRCKTGPYNRRI